MKFIYPACFYPCEEKKGAYTVEVPDLPGCVSEGDSLADAIIMATDAASGWVLDELEDGKPIPIASPLEKIIPKKDGFINLLVLDINSYVEKYGKHYVIKKVSIPAWLDTFAKNNHIDLSEVLQNSLFNIYQKQTTETTINITM